MLRWLVAINVLPVVLVTLWLPMVTVTIVTGLLVLGKLRVELCRL